MNIGVRMAFDEHGALRLLNWLAGENARLLHERPDLPLLYDSGVVYCREAEEVWSDVVNTLAQGHEDCDALSAYRAGELRARGWKALFPGLPGFRLAQRVRPRRIHAEVMLTTRTRPGERGLYHCITKYRIGRRWFRDDPSLRLGMRRGEIQPLILDRWDRKGVQPTVTACPAI